MILAGVVLAVCYRALANGNVFAGPDWLDGDFEVGGVGEGAEVIEWRFAWIGGVDHYATAAQRAD